MNACNLRAAEIMTGIHETFADTTDWTESENTFMSGFDSSTLPLGSIAMKHIEPQNAYLSNHRFCRWSMIGATVKSLLLQKSLEDKAALRQGTGARMVFNLKGWGMAAMRKRVRSLPSLKT